MHLHPKAFAVITCALLLSLFAALSYTAARQKSSTYDEPADAVAAWVLLHFHDYRINTYDPPLAQYWAALPTRADDLRVDWESPAWKGMLEDPDKSVEFSQAVLYHTPGNDGEQIVRKMRVMMLALGVLLGVIIAAWSWKL